MSLRRLVAFKRPIFVDKAVPPMDHGPLDEALENALLFQTSALYRFRVAWNRSIAPNGTTLLCVPILKT